VPKAGPALATTFDNLDLHLIYDSLDNFVFNDYSATRKEALLRHRHAMVVMLKVFALAADKNSPAIDEIKSQMENTYAHFDERYATQHHDYQKPRSDA
jgi:hypothetical protein